MQLRTIGRHRSWTPVIARVVATKFVPAYRRRPTVSAVESLSRWARIGRDRRRIIDGWRVARRFILPAVVVEASLAAGRSRDVGAVALAFNDCACEAGGPGRHDAVLGQPSDTEREAVCDEIFGNAAKLPVLVAESQQPGLISTKLARTYHRRRGGRVGVRRVRGIREVNYHRWYNCWVTSDFVASEERRPSVEFPSHPLLHRRDYRHGDSLLLTLRGNCVIVAGYQSSSVRPVVTATDAESISCVRRAIDGNDNIHLSLKEWKNWNVLQIFATISQIQYVA